MNRATKLRLFFKLRNIVTKNPIGTAVCLLLIVWISVVRVWNEYHIAYGDIRISSTVENIRNLEKGETHSGLKNAHHYAVLSADVYPKRGKDAWVAECDREQVYDEWSELPLPYSIPKKPIGSHGEQAYFDSKIEYQVWWRDIEDPDVNVEVVIAFAGTDGVGDIWSNLYWITRFWPGGWGQYDLARSLGPAIERFVEDKFRGKRIKIISVGHSLGGGLAHQAAYAAKNIKTVFAFDSSSVTGFYSIDKRVRNKSKKGMRIFRIHERGEFLSYLRSLMEVFFPVVEKNPQVITAAINFTSGSTVSEHSIEDLACALMNQANLRVKRDD